MKPARSDGGTAATRPSRPPLQREPNEYMLVDCPIDAPTPTDVPLFPAVPERGAADDLTGDRASSESYACLLHILYCKTQGADFSLWRRELKDIGDDWPRPTTEFHDVCVVAGPWRLLWTLRVGPFNYLDLHVLVVETLSEVELLLLARWPATHSGTRTESSLWPGILRSRNLQNRMKSSSDRHLRTFLWVVNWLCSSCCQRSLLHLDAFSFSSATLLEFHPQVTNDVWITPLLFSETVRRISLSLRLLICTSDVSCSFRRQSWILCS